MEIMQADHAAAAARLASITDRQRAVLDLVVQHWTSKEIARELNISPNTVDQRINAVRAKLGAKDRAETARLYADLNNICGRTIYGPAVIAAPPSGQLIHHSEQRDRSSHATQRKCASRTRRVATPGQRSRSGGSVEGQKTLAPGRNCTHSSGHRHSGDHHSCGDAGAQHHDLTRSTLNQALSLWRSGD